MSKTFLSVALLLAVAAPALRAQSAPANYPSWWSDGAIAGTSITTPAMTHDAADNYKVVNLGQLKHVATRAKAYLDAKLAAVGGSQIDLTKFFPAMPPGPGVAGYNAATYDAAVAANYRPANVGQLKAITKLFYVRLNAVGYDTNAYLKTRGYPATWASRLPWNTAYAAGDNYASANLGQLKLAFGFNLAGFTPANQVDTDGDGIPDSWQTAKALPIAAGAPTDPDGDGLTNLDEYLFGLDPKTAETGAAQVSSVTRTYAYDAEGRLTAADQGVPESFVYDDEGNLTTSAGK